jgi:hypothetical protein
MMHSGSPATSSRKSATVVVRLSAEERDLFHAEAARIGASLSEVLRRLGGQLAGLGPIALGADADRIVDEISQLRDAALSLAFVAREHRREANGDGPTLAQEIDACVAAIEALAQMYLDLCLRGRHKIFEALS